MLDNSSATSGGGIFTAGGVTTIINSTFSGNHANQAGGGLSNQIGTTSFNTPHLSATVLAPEGAGLMKVVDL